MKITTLLGLRSGLALTTLVSLAAPAIAAPSGVIISEFICHTDDPYVDAVEIYNNSSEKADLDGWYLSDKKKLKKKNAFKIRNLTLKPHEYHTFRIGEDEEIDDFSLKAAGEAIVLWNDKGDRVDAITFGTCAHDTSYGRVETSDGRFVLTPLASLTLDAAKEGRISSGPNSKPKIGPVVISEILVSPGPGERAFIELHNISNKTLDLHDRKGPYRVTGADFYFPKKSEIAPGERIVLAYGSKDSSTERSRARRDLNLSATTQVFIFDNRLGSRDSIALQGSETFSPNRPDQPKDDTVYYWDIDRMTYGSDAIDAGSRRGRSWQRAHRSFGEEPTSWSESSVLGGTPGR